MIVIEQQDNLVNVAVLGEFTLADFKQLEEHVLYKIQFQGRVNLLLDLRDMTGFTVDVAWEEIRFSHTHQYDFWKIAVVTDNQWLTWSTWLSSAFIDAGIEVFDDYDKAKTWATSPNP